MTKNTTVPIAFRRLTDVYVGLALSAFLLYPGRGGYETITEEKFRVFFFLTAAYAVLMLVLAVEFLLVGRWKVPSVRALWANRNLVQILILAYWLWTALSTVCSPNRQTAFWGTGRLDGFLTSSLYCIAFFLVSTLARPEKWQLYVYGVSISLCCILSLIQLAGYNPLTLYPEGMRYQDGFKLYAGQFLGTIGNVDMLAAVLSLTIPLLWVGLLRLNSPERFLLLIPLLLSLAVLLQAYVEGGILGVFGGALLTIPVVASGNHKRRKLLAACVAGVLVLGLMIVYFFGGAFSGFVYEASELLHGRWDDSFGSGRLRIWRNVLPLIGERPLFGGGPDTLGLRLDVQFERYSEELGIQIVSAVDNAHNEYLNVAANQGIPALLLYLGALFAAALQWIKHAPEKPSAALLGAAVLGYCVQAFFGLSSIVSTPFFWLAFALLISSTKESCSVLTASKEAQRRKKA